MNKKIYALCAALLLVCCIFQCGCAAGEKSLTVLYTNDVHGELLPHDSYDNPRAIELGAELKNIGGVCRRASYIRSVRKYTKGTVLLLDAGDIFTRGPAEKLEGKPDIELMNLMKYDAAAVGNNELKGDQYSGLSTRSMDILAQREKEAQFPFLCANIYKDGKRLFTPYIIKEADGLRIGIFGVTAETSRTYKSVAGCSFTNPVDEAAEVLGELKPKADIIICLSHAGVIDDVSMANRYKDIDLIVGGHTHTWLPTPLFSADGRPEKNNVKGVIVCSSGEYGVAVGRIDMRLTQQEDGSWAVSKYTGRLVPMTDKYADDPEAKRLLEKHWGPLGLVK